MTIVTKLFLSNLIICVSVLITARKVSSELPKFLLYWDAITTISIPAWLIWLIVTA